MGGLEKDAVKASEDNARDFMEEIEATLTDSQSGWCFGLAEPSALDAHLVVFIARLFDVKRGEMVPEALRVYAEKAMAGAAWNEVMQGRNTFGPSS